MTLTLLQTLLQFGLAGTAVFVFLSVALAGEVGYRLGQRTVVNRPAKNGEASGISTLTAGMLGLLAFTLSLSIGFGQSRYEARRDLVLAEANAIGTAWLRTKLIDGDEGPVIAAKIEDYAKVRLGFTVAASDADVPALVARTNALQDDIWRTTQVVAHRSPNPVTTALINALNEMFDLAASQQFAYESSVPAELMLALYVGALLSIGALGYQFGVAGSERQVVLWSLLLLMWTGGMLLLVDLSQPRIGDIRVGVAPLVRTIQGFGQK
jgi:hypothetical protein